MSTTGASDIHISSLSSFKPTTSTCLAAEKGTYQVWHSSPQRIAFAFRSLSRRGLILHTTSSSAAPSNPQHQTISSCRHFLTFYPSVCPGPQSRSARISSRESTETTKNGVRVLGNLQGTSFQPRWENRERQHHEDRPDVLALI